MQISLNINGLAEVEKKFGDGIPKGAMTSIIRTTGNTLRQQAIRNVQAAVYSRSVPWRRTGKLQQSIILQLSPDSAKVSVGVDYAKFVEYGTRPHVITPKKGKFLVFNSGGKNVITRKVNHPGTKAYPFWRPAISYTRTQIPIIIKKIMDTSLSSK